MDDTSGSGLKMPFAENVSKALLGSFLMLEEEVFVETIYSDYKGGD